MDFPSFYSPPTQGSINQAINWYLDDYNSVWYDPHNIYDLYEENGIEWIWSFVSNKCVYCRRDCILVFPEQLLWGQLHYTKTNGRFFTIQNSWRFSHWQKGNGRFFTIIVQLLIYNWTLVSIFCSQLSKFKIGVKDYLRRYLHCRLNFLSRPIRFEFRWNTWK